MTTLFLIRHGRTAWNAERRIQGQANIRLDEIGNNQVWALARSLLPERFEAIYSSSLHRALRTALAIARGRKLDVVTDDRLIERNYGLWTGMLDAEARRQYPDIFYGNWRVSGIPGGENQQMLVTRAVSFLDDILNRHSDGQIAIASHDCLLGAMLGSILKMPLEMHEALRFENCGYAIVKFVDKKPRLIGVH